MIKLPTFSKSTIKNDPFAAVIPVPEPAEPRPAPIAHRSPARRKLTVHLRPDVIERVKNAAYWNPRLTIAAIAEAGILQAIESIEREQGGPYPPREQELRGGRPIK
jgi:hypothetical protein